MTLDPITITISVLVSITILQQWSMYRVRQDLNEIIDRHNEFVVTTLDILELEEIDGEYP